MKSTEYHVRSSIGSVVQSPTENVLAGPRLPLDGLVAQSTDLVYTSGHYVTMNGSSDYASVTPTFPSPVTDIELLARSTSDGSIPTTYGTGDFTANGTWQNVSITTPAKDYGGKLWLTENSEYVTTTSNAYFGTGEFDFSYKIYLLSFADREIKLEDGFISMNTTAIQLRLGDNFYTYPLPTTASVKTLHEIRFVRVGNNITLYFDGNLSTTRTVLSTDTFNVLQFNQINSANLAIIGGFFTDVDFGNGVTWDGTRGSALNNGWAVIGSPQTVSEYFSTNALEIGRNGSDYFAGDVADVNFKNASGTIIGSWLMGSNDEGTLTGLPEFDRSGNENHLTYTGCTSVIGEGIPEEVWGLDAYENVYGDWYTLPVFGNYPQYSWDSFSPIGSTGFTASNTSSGSQKFLGSNIPDIPQGVTFKVVIDASISGLIRMQGVTTDPLGNITGGATSSAILQDGLNEYTLTTTNVCRGLTIWHSIDSCEITLRAILIDYGSGANLTDKLRTIPQTGLLDWNKRYIATSSVTQGTWGSLVKLGLSVSGSDADSDANGGFFVASGVYTDVVIVSGVCTSIFGTLNLSLKSAYFGINNSNVESITTTGPFELTFTSTSTFDRLNFNSTDNANFEIENLNFKYVTQISKNTSLLASSLSNPAVDALGNTIDDPRNNLLNHTGWNTDRAVIPYDPSLNVTTEAEWFIWGNFYIDDGVAQLKRFVDRYDNPNDKRVFLFYRASADFEVDGKVRCNLAPLGTFTNVYIGSFILSDSHSLLRFQFIGETSFKVWEYNSGSWTELTVTTETGSIPASLFSDADADIPIYLPGTYNTDPLEHWEGQQSPLFLYDRILDDKEVENIRKSTEKLYGQ